jgi:hypothetical protein
MACPHRKDCRLPESLPCLFALRLWQGRYCEGDGFTACARLREVERGHPVPDGMLPSGHVLAGPA